MNETPKLPSYRNHDGNVGDQWVNEFKVGSRKRIDTLVYLFANIDPRKMPEKLCLFIFLFFQSKYQ